jgi:hypothetical protein
MSMKTKTRSTTDYQQVHSMGTYWGLSEGVRRIQHFKSFCRHFETRKLKGCLHETRDFLLVKRHFVNCQKAFLYLSKGLFCHLSKGILSFVKGHFCQLSKGILSFVKGHFCHLSKGLFCHLSKGILSFVIFKNGFCVLLVVINM